MRRSRVRSASAVWVCLLALGHAPGAFAQSSTDAGFEEGRRLLAAGDFAGACAKFAVSYQASPAPGKAFNLATCEEKQGHLTKAVGWLNDGIRALPADDSRREPASLQREKLEERLARLEIVVAEAAPSVRAFVDDAPFEVGVRRPVDPGAHRIVVRAEGREEARDTVTLSEKETKELRIRLGPVIHEPTRVVPPAPVEDSSRGNAQRAAGYVVGGVGILALIGFGTSAGLVASAKSSFDSAATPNEAEAARSRGKKLEIAEGVLLGVGAGAGVAGLVLVITAPRASSPSVRSSASLGFGNVAWRLSW